MIDIELLIKNKEFIAEEVHNAWWEEKKSQGFHPPIRCQTVCHEKAIDLAALKSVNLSKFNMYCDECHADMYPYSELSEQTKDYDRVTVQAVIDAIGKIK